jgi:shikimate dehydrogenase
VIGRRPTAAGELATLASRAGGDGVGIDLADTSRVTAAVAGAHLVVNATPLGMRHEALPEPFMALSGGQIAYDLVYTPPDTPFVTAAAASGAQAHHGLGMLVAQAARAFERWTAHPAPTDTMSAAAIAALSH